MAEEKHRWMDEALERKRAAADAKEKEAELARRRAETLKSQAPQLWRQLCEELKSGADAWNSKTQDTLQRLTVEAGGNTFRASTMIGGARSGWELVGTLELARETTDWQYNVNSLGGSASVGREIYQFRVSPEGVTFDLAIEDLAQRLMAKLIELILS